MNWVTREDVSTFFKGADEDLCTKIDTAVDMVNAQALPRFVTASFFVGEELTFGGFTPSGEDVKKHLRGCGRIYVAVCTIGAEIDKLIERTKLTDLSLAYVVDISASVAVEKFTESVWQKIKADAEKEGKICTTRYSCGYGDFDLADQKHVLKVCGADKALSIRVNEGGMMYPTKTVSFLCGTKEG